MKIKNIILLLSALLAMNCAQAVQMSAGISYDYTKDINESVIYKSSFDFVQIPGIEYSDLGYFIKYKPVDMLSSSEVFIQKRNKKHTALGYNIAPSVYNISFVNGGEADFEENSLNIEKLIKKYPNRPEYIYAYAIKLKMEEKYNEALDEVDRALELDSNYALGHFLKADILRILGDFKEAAREYLVTLQINPYCTDAYFNIAKMLEIYGNDELALSYYQMAYVVSPNDLEIRNTILKLNKKLGMI